MKILISSHKFPPSIGGVESVGGMLAEEFQEQGHQVQVVTQTIDTIDTPLEIHRRPSPRKLWDAVRWCDVFFHNNISLQTAWPLLFLKRPWIITHHTWITRTNGSTRWQDHLKRFLLRYGSSISISQPIADSLPVPSQVIPDPYDNHCFQLQPDQPRTQDLIFVGRLVSDKGVDLLIRALAKIREKNLTASLTIVGDGPERTTLENLVHQLQLTSQVRFLSSRTGHDLAQLLNQHRILMIPSRWEEPFGIVALEGIACGCVPIGSSGGGLKEAIGPCGLTFPNNDLDALSDRIALLIGNPESLPRYRVQAEPHLKAHQRARVAKVYLNLMEKALPSPKGAHSFQSRLNHN